MQTWQELAEAVRVANRDLWNGTTLDLRPAWRAMAYQEYEEALAKPLVCASGGFRVRGSV